MSGRTSETDQTKATSRELEQEEEEERKGSVMPSVSVREKSELVSEIWRAQMRTETVRGGNNLGSHGSGYTPSISSSHLRLHRC